MPGRVARSSVPKKFAQKSAPSQKKSRGKRDRNLDAFAIASEQNPDQSKIKKHRLGETDFENDEPRRKKRRTSDEELDDDDGDESEGGDRPQHKRRREYDGLEAESGSDSEGNEWRFGFDAEAGDEDEDIDSDEAFGESDEERFEDYTFRGSSKKSSLKTAKKRAPDVDLNEDEEAPRGEDEGDDSDGSLGSDAVDLATMLDNPQDSDDEPASKPKSKSKTSSRSLIPADDTDSSDDEAYDDGDDYDTAKLAQLRSMVDSLERADQSSDEEDDPVDLKPGALLAAMQRVADGEKKPTRKDRREKDKANDRALAVPLPKRQQDKVNREAAYQKARETLGRWQNTVKHNREADHLIFPLHDPTANEAVGTSRMAPASTNKPLNDLESAIHGILQESGLVSRDNKRKDETEGDELPENKPSLEEVKARRGELRRARELLFREEQRAKRIKKIKSKAYRRVHRKERERNEQKERELMGKDDDDMSEDEKERYDRRRAEERMGARHRESKWAKNAKKTGQLTWNDDARAGVEDMARRDEELRRRIQGQKANGDDESDESDDVNSSDEEGFALRTQQQLDELDHDDKDAQKSRLASLKFMERAEASRKKQNDEAVKELRRDMAEEDDESSSEPDEPVGRRTYGPSAANESAQKKPKKQRNEFEEGSASESESEAGPIEPAAADEWIAVPSKKQAASGKKTNKQTLKSAGGNQDAKLALTSTAASATTPNDNKKGKKGKRSKHHEKDTTGPIAPQETPTLQDDSENETSNDPEDKDDTALTATNESLLQSAFGIDDTDAAAFAAEKRAATTDEAPQSASTALPGWGAWAGAGLSKATRKAGARAAARASLRRQTAEGVAAAARRDRALPDVILSERRSRRNARYLAPALPFPYESGAQYERGLRVPLGPEWVTKSTFEAGTKPRVIVKQGIVKPMERPM